MAKKKLKLVIKCPCKIKLPIFDEDSAVYIIWNIILMAADAREIVDDHKAIKDRYTHSLLFCTNILAAVPLVKSFAHSVPYVKIATDVLRITRVSHFKSTMMVLRTVLVHKYDIEVAVAMIQMVDSLNYLIIMTLILCSIQWGRRCP
ncbi:phosphorelay sensor kinase [Aureococcus anophagefferens]|nr:phosphorelay sensor kinase [Aureococcus anophagefferens]